MPELLEVQLELRGVAAQLSALFFHLAALASSIPLTLEETSHDDLDDEPPASVQIRSAILAGMHDHLRPLARDLLVAAGRGAAEAEGALPDLAEELVAAVAAGDEAPEGGA